MNAFIDHIKPYIDNITAFTDALNAHKNRAYRITASRNVPYCNELDRLFASSPVDGVNSAYFIDDNYDKAADTLSFQTGGIYLQNPSSVLPAQLLAGKMPDEPAVLDMAAAPGGKTCALSDMLGRQGIIIANEPSRARLKSLNFNLERCGAWNVKTISADGSILHKHYSDTFDGILLDAPCSHENQIGLNKKVREQWSVDYVHKLARLQKQLILSAFDCLKPGGTLVYSTCTFSVEENEAVIAHLLEKRDDAALELIEHPYSRGISGISTIDEAVLRVFPHMSDMDGFFVAMIHKDGSLQGSQKPNIKINKDHKALIDVYFTEFPDNYMLKQIDSQVYLEAKHDIKGSFFRSGMVFAKQAGKKLELTSQAAWEFGSVIKDEHKVNVDYDQALAYMKGFDTAGANKYDGTVFCHTLIPVGMVKIVDQMYKNKLDRYFLYGKNIEF